MRINDYNNLNEFILQYVGIWDPSDNHWLGLDFSYKNIEYRLHTGSMFNSKDTILEDGRTAMFGLYRKQLQPNVNYKLLEEYADMEALLNSTVIENTPFREIIMDDETELLGQD